MSSEVEKTSNVVSVALPVALSKLYFYKVPSGRTIVEGAIVSVHLKARKLNGVVWNTAVPTRHNRPLKEIELIHDCPPLSDTLRIFIEWVANYYVVPLGMVIKMVLNAPEAFFAHYDKPTDKRLIQLKKADYSKITRTQQQVVQQLSQCKNNIDDVVFSSRSELATSVGVSTGVIDRLIAKGILDEVPVKNSIHSCSTKNAVILNQEQETAAVTLEQSVSEKKFSVFLLEGVTGSGKTEVYFRAVARALALGKQVLILLPEVALTSQVIERFCKQFKLIPDEWHSRITKKNRAICWRKVANREVALVVGARSAIYLPFTNLGLIIVDEEHDESFKQTEGVSYHARDIAVMYGKLNEATVILSSATPSVESLVNVTRNRYKHILLQVRAGGATLPDIEVVDLKSAYLPRGRYISPVLTEILNQTLNTGGQGILFINRRGYSPLLICRKCGFRYQCKNCSTWLVEHRKPQVLLCHYCGYSVPVPKACANCKTVGNLIHYGPGVEKIAEEAADLFPDARRLVLSSDLPGGFAKLREGLELIERGEIDIIIGTQLIAKGHNFPKVKAVGVVDTDVGLSNGDLRASERTFQLLQQVTGRAGRTKGGTAKGIIQTYSPNHPLILAIASGSPRSFYDYEIRERLATGMPPFQRLAAIVVKCKTRELALSYAEHLAQHAPEEENLTLLGPVEAPLAILRGQHRFRMILRASKTTNLQDYLIRWMGVVKKPTHSVDVHIDVDPYNFL